MTASAPGPPDDRHTAGTNTGGATTGPGTDTGTGGATTGPGTNSGGHDGVDNSGPGNAFHDNAGPSARSGHDGPTTRVRGAPTTRRWTTTPAAAARAATTPVAVETPARAEPTREFAGLIHLTVSDLRPSPEQADRNEWVSPVPRLHTSNPSRADRRTTGGRP